MSKTIMKKGLRGFTLIELMVVIAIIGILATLIAAPIGTYLKKTRDAKRIADMNQLANSLGQYAIDNNGNFPTDLNLLVTGNYLKALPPEALAAASTRTKYMYVTYEDTTGPLSYHLGVPLEFTNSSLSQDRDCFGSSCFASMSGITVTFRNAGSNFGAGNPTASVAGPVANGPTPASDFNGAGTQEDSGEVCTAVLDTCIYDIVP